MPPIPRRLVGLGVKVARGRAGIVRGSPTAFRKRVDAAVGEYWVGHRGFLRRYLGLHFRCRISAVQKRAA
jgi:hypothetical protein